MMRRYCVNLSDEAVKVWDDYQAKTGLKRDPALDALLLEFGGLKPPEPVEPEEPTRCDVEVSQKGDLIQVRAVLRPAPIHSEKRRCKCFSGCRCCRSVWWLPGNRRGAL